MNSNKDIKKEAQILSVVARCISEGIIKPNEEQLQMIVSINNQLYRKSAKKEKDTNDLER